MIADDHRDSAARRTFSATARLLSALKLDGPLLVGLGLLAIYALIVQYSASGQDIHTIFRTLMRLALGGMAMILLAHTNPNFLRSLAPWLYGSGIVLLLVVYAIGMVGKGAQRWLQVGGAHFQPAEIMKLGVPMMCAWLLHERPLPPRPLIIVLLAVLVLVPVALVALQPDLGTALLIGASGMLLILLSGLRVRVILPALVLGIVSIWFVADFKRCTHVFHAYQCSRVQTLIDPSTDRLGKGYHAIQSAIAIGSGGLFGKGWMNGSQAQLEFLPERSTDFIMAVIGEEFGLLGLIVLMVLYLFIVSRSVYLASQTSGTFARLLALTLALTFFVYVFINASMVVGLLPVVGVPLPLVSYGGTSVVTLLAGFGILMGLHSHRKLVNS